MNFVKKHFQKWSPAVFIGYNSILFDEEVLRFSLFKSLMEPYVTTQKGNMRGDSLSIVRASSIYNSHVIKVTLNEKGNPTFKLDKLAPLNDIVDFEAHNALGDALATSELLKSIKMKSPKFWEECLQTSNKINTENFVETEKVFCTTENIFGKVKGFVVQFIDYHPSYNWILCFDLKNDPSDFVNLSDEELKKILLRSPKVIRVVKANKHPILLKFNHFSKLDLYMDIGEKELLNRARKIHDNNNLKKRIVSIIENNDSDKYHNISQLDVFAEETLYNNFASDFDKAIMKKFHDARWEEKLSIAGNFKDERFYYFAEKLLYEENPELLPKDIYNKVNRNIAEKILSTNNEKWNTITKAYKEIDDLRDNYDKENDIEGIKRIEDLNHFIEEIEKKYEKA